MTGREKCGVLQLGRRQIPIFKGVNQIGRKRDAVVVLEDYAASQHHALLCIVDDDCHYISDLKSMNGTLLNCRQLNAFEMYCISDGDEVQFTPSLKGIYRKLTGSSSQISRLTETVNTVQFTQNSDDTLFTTKTQRDFFNDGIGDEEMSRIEVMTQGMSDVPVSTIHDVATQLAVNTQAYLAADKPSTSGATSKQPNIHEAATQVLSFVADIQPDPSFNEMNIDNYNTLSALQSVANQETITTSTLSQTAPKTGSSHNSETITEEENEALSVPNVVIDKDASNEQSNAIEAPRDENTNEEFDLPDTQCSQIKPVKRRTINPLDSDSDTDVEDNSSVPVPNDGSASDTDIEENLQSRPLRSSMNLQLNAESSNLALNCDLSANETEQKSADNQHIQKESVNGIYSDDTDVDEDIGYKCNSVVTTNQSGVVIEEKVADNETEVAHGIHSDDTDVEEDLQNSATNVLGKEISGSKLTGTVRESSASRSKFYISDSDDDELEDSRANNETLLKFGKKSFTLNNESVDAIPATQDVNSSFQVSRRSMLTDSFDLGLSAVRETTESPDLAFQNSVNNENTAHLGDELDTIDSSQPSQDLYNDLPGANVKKTQNLLSSLISDEATQPLDTISNQENSNRNEAASSDCDFSAPTQPLNVRNGTESEDFFAQPTQPIVRRTYSRKKSSLQREPSASECDFLAPTQPLIRESRANEGSELLTQTQPMPEDANPGAESQSPLRKFGEDEYLAPTQPLILRKKQLSILSKDIHENDSDPFLASTQLLPLPSGDNIDDIDFAAPTQPLCVPSPPPTLETKTYTEAETQRIEDVEDSNAVAVKQPAQEVESQLEVMFETQNLSISVPDSSRPTNPMASTFEINSTQEVVEALTGSAKKRNSDEFDDVQMAKKPKQNVTSKPGKTKTGSILNYFASTSKTCPVSKLSLKKTDNIELADESDDFISFDFVQPFGETNLVETREMPKTHSPEKSPHETSLVSDIEGKAEKKVSKKGRKRKILSVDQICDLSLVATPQNDEKTKQKTGRKTRSQQPVTNIDVDTDIDEESTPVECDMEKGKNKSPKLSSRKQNEKSKVAQVSDETTPKLRRGRSKKVTGDEHAQGEIDINAESGKAVKPANDKKPGMKYKGKKKVDFENIENKPVQVEIKNVKVVLTRYSDDHASGIEAESPDVSVPKKRLRARNERQGPSEPTIAKSTPKSEVKLIRKPKIVFTMIDDPQLNTIIRKLGGSVVEKIEDCTVLVTSKIQRTTKLLSAIGLSKPICTPAWIEASKDVNGFVDPWQHLISDPEAESKWGFTLRDSYDRSQKQKLFQGFTFQLLISSTVDTIKGGIQNNGGKVVARKPADVSKFIVVAAETQKNRYAKFLKDKISVVSSEAILISILRQRLVFNDYSLA